MTSEQLKVRRWLQVALLLALVAPAVFIGLALADTRSDGATSSAGRPAAPPFPVRLRLAEVSGRPLALAAAAGAGPTASSLRWTVPAAHGTAYLVGRCSVGSMSVRLGRLSTSVSCTGAPVLIGAFALPGRVGMAVAVSAVQPVRWGVALYTST